MKSPNRRHYPRIPIAMTVRVTPKETDRSYHALTRCISTHGIGLFTKEPVQKGEQVLIGLSFTTDENERLTSSMMGEVMWCAPVVMRKDQYVVGIYFHQMEKDHPKVYAYLKHLENTVLLDEFWKEGT